MLDAFRILAAFFSRAGLRGGDDVKLVFLCRDERVKFYVERAIMQDPEFAAMLRSITTDALTTGTPSAVDFKYSGLHILVKEAKHG
jgi:hypothetical protein